VIYPDQTARYHTLHTEVWGVISDWHLESTDFTVWKSAKKKVKVLFYPVLPIFQKALLLEGFQMSPVCPSGNSSMHMKMSIENW
jgi:hypothetical protein